MKKLLLILFISVQLKNAAAQSWVYHPFPSDSAIWTNANGTWDVHPTTPPTATLIVNPTTRYCMTSADTTIGSNTYSKVEYCGGAYRGALRDDGVGKVYFVPADSLTELLIYDFTVLAGHTVTVYETPHNDIYFSPYTYTAGAVDSILINGSYRKRINIDGEYWIEGIGCTNGLFTESWPNVSNWYVNLDCMSYMDTTLYPSYSIGACSLYSGIDELKKDDQFTLFPNPTTGKFMLKWSGEKQRIVKIYTVIGSLVRTGTVENEAQLDLSDQPQGIYFLMIRDENGYVLTKKIVKQ